MNKKGFTLIELLAVIIVLAIIALISIPVVLNIITKAEEKAFIDSGYGLLKAAEFNYTESVIDGNNGLATYTFSNGEETSLEKLLIKGVVPKDGLINVDKNGNTELALHDGKYCLTKNFSDSKILTSEKSVEECLSNINPIIAKFKVYTSGINKKANLSSGDLFEAYHGTKNFGGSCNYPNPQLFMDFNGYSVDTLEITMTANWHNHQPTIQTISGAYTADYINEDLVVNDYTVDSYENLYTTFGSLATGNETFTRTYNYSSKKDLSLYLKISSCQGDGDDFLKVHSVKVNGIEIDYLKTTYNSTFASNEPFSVNEYSDGFESELGVFELNTEMVSRQTDRPKTGSYSARFDYSVANGAVRRVLENPISINHGTAKLSYWFNIASRTYDDAVIGFSDSINATGISLNPKREGQSDMYLTSPGISSTIGGPAATGVTLLDDVWYKFEAVFNNENSILNVYSSDGTTLVHTRTVDLTEIKQIDSFVVGMAMSSWSIYLDDISITNN